MAVMMKTNDAGKKTLISKLISSENTKPPKAPTPAGNLPLFQRPLSAFSWHRTRELSDIREVSGSSKAATIRKRPSAPLLSQPSPEASAGESDVPDGTSEEVRRIRRTTDGARGLGTRVSSAMSLPLKDVPERTSSASVLSVNARSRQSSVQNFPSWKLPPPSAVGQAIPSRGRSNSPVRGILEHDAISCEKLERSPSKTFIRTAPPLDILDQGNIRHGRVEMALRLAAPLFVGGGTIEGQIQLTVDRGTLQRSKLNPIYISKLSIDVIGVEEVSDGRRWIFLSLATELFGEDHPPPPSLVTSQLSSHSELFWLLKPASISLPFCVNLPLNVGPPPYSSKVAGIRYYICPTALVKTGGKQSALRQLCNIQLMTVHDPEKALASLACPLLASDSVSLPSSGGPQLVKLTAGLHRQTWVNGAMIFVDVHIANQSSKTVRKIEIQLEKTTLWYAHAAAGTSGTTANYLRLPKKTEDEIVSTSVIKKSKEWPGVFPSTSEVRTCDIAVPRGHVTISTGRYFEIRYFLNIVVTAATFKTIAVQLPVTIIHINSLDILPNSLAQVAASIEAKRARTVPRGSDEPLFPRFQQGQAFTAPRRQSLDRMRSDSRPFDTDELSALTRDLDDSPRRYARSHCDLHGNRTVWGTAASAENVAAGRRSLAPSLQQHHTGHSDCCKCRAVHRHHARRRSSVKSSTGPKLPRLQLSTSGLGFSDSEFEIAPDSPPRKVMLSQSEREMILQQRELKLHREQSKRSKRRPSIAASIKPKEGAQGQPGSHWGWRNVAAGPSSGITEPELIPRQQSTLKGSHKTSVAGDRVAAGRPTPARLRSRTNPERMALSPNTRRRAQRSGEQPGRIPARASIDAPIRVDQSNRPRNPRYPRPSLERW